MFLELILSLNVLRTVGRRLDAVASARPITAVATVNPLAIGVVAAARGAGEWLDASDERGLGHGGEPGGKGVPGREDGRRKGGDHRWRLRDPRLAEGPPWRRGSGSCCTVEQSGGGEEL